jgi:subtilisin family serine protease
MLGQKHIFISNFKFYFFSLAATLLIVGLAQAQTGKPPGTPGEPSHGRHVTDEILVKYEPGVNGSQITTIEHGSQASWRSSGRHGRVRRLGIRRGSSIEEALAEFRSNPLVEYAEPNFIAEINLTPNDTFYYPYQWNMDNTTNGGIHAEAAWDISTGAGATVAVLDTGVAYEDYTPGPSEQYCKAPDLASTCFVPPIACGIIRPRCATSPTN